MSRKFALKRLTASDLTFFKWHYQQNPTAKQKAFNLDAKVLSEFFPHLAEPALLPVPRFPVNLDLIGPGLPTSYNLQRKILKQQKNWRLNGELVDNPLEDPDRYNGLAPGDHALIELSGDLVPDTAKILLISKESPNDLALHEALNVRYPEGSMWAIEESEIASLLQEVVPAAGHPLYEWQDGATIEDAARGGSEGIRKLRRRSGGRGLSPEELKRARVDAEKTGLLGEIHLNAFFEKERAEGRVRDIEWASSVNAICPYDFRRTELDGSERFVDAKSTKGAFENALHMSLGEMVQAVGGDQEYDLYRLYEVNETAAKMRVAKNVGPTLKPVLDSLLKMPDGITVDSISIRPEFVVFIDDEIELRLDED